MTQLNIKKAEKFFASEEKSFIGLATGFAIQHF